MTMLVDGREHFATRRTPLEDDRAVGNACRRQRRPLGREDHGRCCRRPRSHSESRRLTSSLRRRKRHLKNISIDREEVAQELDLLTLVEAARDVVDRDLHWAVAVHDDRARELDVEVEALGDELDALDALARGKP